MDKNFSHIYGVFRSGVTTDAPKKNFYELYGKTQKQATTDSFSKLLSEEQNRLNVSDR